MGVRPWSSLASRLSDCAQAAISAGPAVVKKPAVFHFSHDVRTDRICSSISRAFASALALSRFVL